MKSGTVITFAMLLLSGCHTAKQRTPKPGEGGGSEKLYTHRWELREVEGLTLMPTTVGKVAYLLFEPGKVNKVSGSTGCNRLNGTFELSGVSNITFSPLATTKMACPPDGNNTEQRFLSALTKVKHFQFSENNLLLLDENTVVARFAASVGEGPGQ